MPSVLRIALQTPLRQLFDYLEPAADSGRDPVEIALLKPGVRVRVPFGRRSMVGVLVETARESTIPATKLKAALEILDSEPVLDPELLGCVRWAAEYYHHPLGDAAATALPVAVRKGKALTDAKPNKRSAAKKTKRKSKKSALTEPESAPAENPPADSGATNIPSPAPLPWTAHAGPPLTAAQTTALQAIDAALDGFTPFLLHGVTGSGKTEVYLRAVEQVLKRGRQALVLVPEIALTPQLVGRFQERFAAPIVALHSGLNDTQRFKAWLDARSGAAAIVIGTRSAVFTPLARPGIFIVDEEHDGSYKQQDGFRYSARDLALVRAQRLGVPVVLGSATPALETLENARAGRYTLLTLPERPGEARHPKVSLVDLQRHAADAGLATPVLIAIDKHLRDGGQVLVYLNRRGYAPTLFCPGCGWVAPCRHCDARMTVHMRAQILRCHHCGAEQTLPFGCPTCGHEVSPVGQGTERVEQTLRERFPQATLARFDRDSVRRKGEMQAVLDSVTSGAARILVGTQMLTKGHHFPDVTLVVIVNADQGLFSADFRASERLAQTIVQVAGRAGRAARPGEVLIQTQFPDHPLLKSLLASGYEGFAATALQERAEAHWPPFTRLALVRADARQPEIALQFLETARAAGEELAKEVRLLGPVVPTMARRADHHHAQLLIESTSRSHLHRFLSAWLPSLEQARGVRGIRWSLDVDPADLF